MHYKDAKGILSRENGMNLYRGCTHGCIYCDSRSLCYGMEHPFEDVEIKKNASILLKKALQSRRARCMIGTGSMSDPYQPVEEREQLTRQCLEIIESYGFGATLITKSPLVLRDLELLQSIHRKAKCVVQMTLTTYDEGLCRILEPHVATTRQRLQALAVLQEAGIPTVVWLSPILPFLNDTEENLQRILGDCFAAGVKGIINFGMGVTLRAGNREYFYAALDARFPKIKEQYQAAFGNSYICVSPNQDKLMRIFRSRCRDQGVMCRPDEVFGYLREISFREDGKQLSLFD